MQRTNNEDVKIKKIMWGVTAVALVVRLVNLGKHSYWFDEAREVVRILTPWPNILFVNEGADPPLFRLLHHPLAQISTNEMWLRMPATLFSTAACYLVFVWLRQLGQPKLGAITAVLLAFAPVQILYAQEVSQYSMTVFLAMSLLIVFERAARNGRYQDWALLSIVNLIAIFSYYGLAWMLPVLNIDLIWRLWQKRTKNQLLGYAAYLGSVGLGIAGLYWLYLSEQFTRVSQNNKVVILFLEIGVRKTFRRLDNRLYDQFVRFFIAPFSKNEPDLIPLLFIGLFIIGIIVLWQMKAQRVFLLLLFLLATLFIAYGFGLYPFGHRYGLYVSPLFFAVIAAALLGLWRWRILAIGVTVLIGALFFLFLPNMQNGANPWMTLPFEELRPVVQYMHENVQPDDLVYVYYGAVPGYMVYQELGHETVYGPWFREWSLDEKVGQIQESVGESPRFWVLFSHYSPEEYEALRNALVERELLLIDVYEEIGAAALLFEQ
jgi:uncharacterized membrane protein